MQELRFDASVTGLASHAEQFVAVTQDGSIYFVNSKTGAIDQQAALPPDAQPVGPPLFSRDGTFLWISSGSSAYFLAGAEQSVVDLDSPIASLFAHPDGSSVFALLADNSLCRVTPSDDSVAPPASFDAQIVSVVVYQNKAIAVTPTELRFIDALSLDVEKVVAFDARMSPISFCSASDFGVVVIWADGFWSRFSDLPQSDGNCISAHSYDLVGSHLCCACEDCVRIFDLKFDAELQTIGVFAHFVRLFQAVVVSAFRNQIFVRPWSGLKQTTTRDLIGTASPVECAEFKVDLPALGGNLDQPIAEGVSLRDPTFRFRSVGYVVDRFLQQRYVPQSIIDEVFRQIEDAAFDGIRDLVRFHLSAVVPLETVKRLLEQGETEIARLMLKKLERLNGHQIAEFIRLALSPVDSNEMILVQFLTQPHDEQAMRDAAKMLTVDEVDRLLGFLAKLLRSRRMWPLHDAAMSALDGALAWGSRLITACFAALAIQKKTNGLLALRKELEEEAERIQAAAACWSIFENIREQRHQTLPPFFMYLVEKIDTGLPD